MVVCRVGHVGAEVLPVLVAWVVMLSSCQCLLPITSHVAYLFVVPVLICTLYLCCACPVHLLDRPGGECLLGASGDR